MVTGCSLSNTSMKDCQECDFVEQMWDIKKLIDDLNQVKAVCESYLFYDGMTLESIKSDADLSKKYQDYVAKYSSTLTEKEKCYLFLLLNGWGYEQFEKKRSIRIATVKSELSRGIYKYVKFLTSQDKIKHPLFVKEYLEPEYRTKVVRDIKNTPNNNKISLTLESLSTEQLKILCSFIESIKK
jgi:hypothetical protein